MERSDILKKLNDIFIDVMDLDDDFELNEDMSADDIEEWDSLSHIQLMKAIEATFGIVSSDRYIRVYAQNIDGYKQALSYIQGFSVNGDYIVFPENATYASNATLSVISHTPENTYYYEDVYTPDLSYTISDINSLAEDGFQLMINGKDYTQYEENTCYLIDYGS